MAVWASCEIIQSSRLTKSYHPLHVVTFQFKTTLFCEQVPPPVFFAALSPLCVQKSRTNATCLFVTVHRIEEAESKPPELKPSRGPKTEEFIPDVSLYVSKFFIEHYGINTGEYYSVKVVNPPHVGKVVLGVTTEEAYNWTKQEHWATDLLISVCKAKLLCRQGDPLLWDIQNAMKDDVKKWEQHCLHIVVLETRPVFQGVLTVNTQITVVQLSEAHALQIKQLQAAHTFGFYPVPGQNDMNPLAPLSLIHFTSSLVLPHTRRNNKLFNPVLAILGSAYRILISIKLKFSVSILPMSPFVSLALIEPDIVDPLNIVFIAKTTAERVGLEDHTWVKISLVKEETEGSDDMCGDSAKEAKKERYAQIYHIPVKPHGNIRSHLLGQTMEDVLLVSPQLWFNLNDQPSSLIQPNVQMVVERTSTSKTVPQETATPTTFNPPYADEVNVALVQAPLYDASKSFDALLTKYFDHTRYLQKGDIISVGSTDNFDMTISGDEPHKMKHSTVYFKVSSIRGDQNDDSIGFLISRKSTKLYQTGAVASFVPLTMDLYESKENLHPIWRSLFPSGIKKYVATVKDLILPYFKAGFIRHHLPPTVLLTGSAGCGKVTILECACRHLNLHQHIVDCYDLVSDTSGATEAKLKQAISAALVVAPAVLVLRHVNILCKVKDGSQDDARTIHALKDIASNLQTGDSCPIVIIGTAKDAEKLPSDMRAFFLHVVRIEPPSEIERRQIIDGLLTSACTGHNIDIAYVTQQTVGFVLGDLCALVSSAVHQAYNRVSKRLALKFWLSPEEEEELCMAGVFLQHSDMEKALELLQADFSDSLGAPKVPNVMWDDIGGLQDIKNAILDTIQIPLQHPELFASGLRRSGVLLFGPPGTGKTLLAKAVATECQLHFLSVKGPELLNMYVGQSEENVREVFRRARNAAPCVIFFDELDSLAPNRGRSGDSGGVMDRVVSQLLAELDGMDKAMNVFVVGATNRPDLIDPSLLRPGRFDKLLYVGIGRDQGSQLKILSALTRKFRLAENLNLEEVVALCPPHLTGADMYALCSDALTQAMSKRIMKMEKDGVEDTEPLFVDLEDFEKAAEKLVPSVSEEELAGHPSQLGLITMLGVSGSWSASS